MNCPAPREKRLNHVILLGFVFLLCLASTLPAAAQCTDSWTGSAGDNNWGTSANWSTGKVPGNSDSACIQTGGAGVSLNVNGGVATLTLGSSDILTIPTVTNASPSLNIVGSLFSNSGQLILAPPVSFGSAVLTFNSGGAVTLSGPGTIIMNSNSFGSSAIGGNASLLNMSTIQGAGSFDMTFNNSSAGVINGNEPGFQLVIGRNQGLGASSNTGVIEATNGGQIAMGSLTINNVGGTIQAVGTGSSVSLVNEGQGGQTITGGTFTTSSGGVIYAGNSTTMDGTNGNTITNKGTLAVSEPQGGSSFQGTVNNSGTLQILPTANGVVLTIPSGQTLTLMGTGNVTMGDGTSNAYNNKGGWGGGTLVNQQTIQGTGTILNLTSFTNSGTIDANIPVGPNSLVLQLGRAGASTNTGTLEATNGGVLQIGSTTINNVGGTISASGTGSSVQLVGSLGTSGLTITGGTYNGSGGGLIYGEGGSLLDGTTSTVTNIGAMALISGDLQVQGTMMNAGNIQILPPTDGNSDVFLQIPNGENLTLTGTGTVTMGDGTDNSYNSNADIGNSLGTDGTFDNQSTIEGTGGIVLTSVVTNDGTILANVPTGSNNLMLQIDRVGNIQNNGTIHATNGGVFYIGGGSCCGNPFSNAGTLIADANSTVNLQNANPFSNLANSVLTGGTYTVTGTLLLPGNVDTNAAKITLNGAAAQILNPNTNALAGFNTNSATGSFTINQGQNFTSAGTFTNMGSVLVGTKSIFTVGTGGNYVQTGGKTVVTGRLTTSATVDEHGDPAAAGSVMIMKGSLLGNRGNVQAAVTSMGTVIPAASTTTTGTLTITGAYTQVAPGALDAIIAGTSAGQFDVLNVKGTAALGGTLNIKLLNNFVPLVGATFKILTAQSVSGTFAKVNGTTINGSEHFTVTYNSNNVTLTVVSGE